MQHTLEKKDKNIFSVENKKLLDVILDVDGNDLLIEDEKQFNTLHVKKLREYAEGKADGVQIKNLTAGAAAIAKRQQSRSAVAVLKWGIIRAGHDISPIIDQ